MSEEWKTIEGFYDFKISTLGRIYRISTGRYLKSNNAEILLGDKFCQVGRLMLETFVGPPPDKDSKARHLDDNRENNTLSNLAWGTQQDNVHDALRNGVFGAKGRVQTPEERLAKSITMTGQKRSEEFSKKQSENALAQVQKERDLGVVRVRPKNLNFSGRTHTEEWKRLASIRKKGKPLVKGRIWITNGVDCKMVFPEEIPEGWRKGRK
jgi:hypothetical protein